MRSQRDLFVRRDQFAPGTASQYSNTNYIELGLLIGQGTHLSAEQAFQRYLWRPLDMDQTSLPSRADTTIPDPLPRGYSQLSRVNHIVDETDWNPSWGWTVGSVISTEHDLKIWAKALATWHLLSAAMQHERLSFTPHSNNLYGLLISHFRGFLGHDSRVPGFNSSMFYRCRLARRSLCSSIPIQQKTALSWPTSSWGSSSKSSLSEEVHIPARR